MIFIAKIACGRFKLLNYIKINRNFSVNHVKKREYKFKTQIFLHVWDKKKSWLIRNWSQNVWFWNYTRCNDALSYLHQFYFNFFSIILVYCTLYSWCSPFPIAFLRRNQHFSKKSSLQFQIHWYKHWKIISWGFRKNIEKRNS